MTDWYRKWFDSPYYHVLYRERDDREAKHFLDNILLHLRPAAGARMLDQACGRGRHALYLAGLGYDVTGTDLSEANIAHCLREGGGRAAFYVHDMRLPFRDSAFDYVFNIFTSMGYFGTDAEHRQVVESAARNLRPAGSYIVDFMNVQRLEQDMVAEEDKEVDGIRFHIRRSRESGFIRKRITFTHRGRPFDYEERVEALALPDFERYFRHAGLVTRSVFGDYGLEPFDRERSARLILVAEKIKPVS